MSNLKQIALAYLQYVGDYDETLPIAYKAVAQFGPYDAVYNTLTSCGSAPTQPCGGVAGQPSGPAAELFPYTKSWDVQLCPDDHPQSAAEIASLGTSPPTGINTSTTLPTIIGMTYYQMNGTSYTYTHESYSDPFSDKTITGYQQSLGCTSLATAVGKKSTGSTSDCEIVASPGEATNTGGKYWLPLSTDAHGAGVALPGAITMSFVSRPSETKLAADQNTNWTDNPKTYPFHPNGTSKAFMDGHAKYLVKFTDDHSGCDGVDWAWDTPGTCNSQMLQRGAD